MLLLVELQIIKNARHMYQNSKQILTWRLTEFSVIFLIWNSKRLFGILGLHLATSPFVFSSSYRLNIRYRENYFFFFSAEQHHKRGFLWRFYDCTYTQSLCLLIQSTIEHTVSVTRKKQSCWFLVHRDWIVRVCT